MICLEPKAPNVNQLITDMDGLICRALEENIAVSWQVGADLWLAWVDPAQIENALLNLGFNARDAMLQGGQLTLQTTNVRFVRHWLS